MGTNRQGGTNGSASEGDSPWREGPVRQPAVQGCGDLDTTRLSVNFVGHLGDDGGLAKPLGQPEGFGFAWAAWS